MSQFECMEFLESHRDKEYTSSQIAGALGISVGSVTVNLNRLWKHQDVTRRKSWKLHHQQYLYKLTEEKR